MNLWCISDLHLEQRAVFDPQRPDFDILVVAGDVSENIEEAVYVTARLAGGRPAVFVGGNHDSGRLDTTRRCRSG
jgi:3',5'-cyclic AMP phosphodiesterase CpdA